MIFSPFSCPIFLGHAKQEAAAPKASGRFMGGTCAVRVEPEKQKPRSCRAQELARSSAQKNARQKKATYRNQTASWAKADSSQRSAKLLVTQCHYGIDAGCAAGGQVAGGEGDQ